MSADALPLTIHQLALARGIQPNERGAYPGGEYERVGLAILGGCASCAATIAAYNAHPSRSGYWLCSDCISPAAGFASAAEFEAWAAEAAAEAAADVWRHLRLADWPADADADDDADVCDICGSTPPCPHYGGTDDD